MADEKIGATQPENPEEDYEILPHRELHELRDQLSRLKERPTEKTLQLAMAELSSKVDRLINIFEEALDMVKIEEGGLSITDKLKPIMEKQDKLLEQNSQIAEGIVGLSDMLGELKEGIETLKEQKQETGVQLPSFGVPGMSQQGYPGGMGQPPSFAQPGGIPGFPPPPPPPR